MRVYLTGFMGSGKSTVGPRVAETLGYAYLDLDYVIAKEAGRSIPELFAAEGEAAFRTAEREALHRTAQYDRLVVALGGGALVDAENLPWALAHGLVVYLRVGAGELVRRLYDDRDRPLLLNEDGQPRDRDALKAHVEALLAARDPFYRQAHVTVDAGAPSVTETVDAVVRAIAGEG